MIVLGGGLSNISRLYANVPRLWAPHVFSDRVDTQLVRAKHGDASGVRGAAWLWELHPSTQHLTLQHLLQSVHEATVSSSAVLQ